MADNEQVTLDNPDIPLVDWKSARNKGEDTVKLPAVEDEKDDQEDKKADEAKGQDEEKAKPKVKGGFQVKIDRLTKLNADLEKRAEQAEREREELRAKTGKTEDKPKADDEPKLEDFQDEHSYLKALAKWEVKQEMKAEREQQEREAEQAETKAIFDAHNERISAARAKYDDFDEMVNESVKTPWQSNSKADVIASQAFQVALIESENGGEVIYYLGKHPEELAKLGGLSPARIQMAVGRLVDKLEAKSEEDTDEETPKGKKAADEDDEEEKPKKVPVKPISGTAKSDVALTEMSLREFKKARNAGRVR